MFELYDQAGAVTDRWFGGGTDLTPYYLFETDARHFHQTYKEVCDRFDDSFYPEFKKNCDNYFVNYHRDNERRGIGGIFYDYQRPDAIRDVDFWIDFGTSCGKAFIPAYILILFLTIAVDYAAGFLIARSQGARRQFYLAASIIVTPRARPSGPRST